MNVVCDPFTRLIDHEEDKQGDQEVQMHRKGSSGAAEWRQRNLAQSGTTPLSNYEELPITKQNVGVSSSSPQSKALK